MKMDDGRGQMLKLLTSRSQLTLGTDRTDVISKVLEDATNRLWLINSHIPDLEQEPAFFL